MYTTQTESALIIGCTASRVAQYVPVDTAQPLADLLSTQMQSSGQDSLQSMKHLCRVPNAWCALKLQAQPLLVNPCCSASW
jgi:hypothetical protein